MNKLLIFGLLVITLAVPALAQMKGTTTVLDTGTGAGAKAVNDEGTNLCANITLTPKFPTDSSAAKAQCFWQQNGFEVLKQAQMVATNGSVAANPEVMSDFFYGWRIAFSMAVASEPDESEVTDSGQTADEAAALNLLQTNGGNMALSAQYPLYLRQKNDAANGSAGFLAATYVRLGAISDAFGDTGGADNLDWSTFSANAEWALTTQTKVMTLQNVFNLEVYTNVGLIAGTKTFRTSVGADADDHGVFGHAEIGANFKIGQSMLIGASWNHYTADGIDGGATVTIGLTGK